MAAAALRQAFIQPDRVNASQTLRQVADQLRSQWPKLKIGAKVVSHSRYVAFQMAEVAVPRTLFAEILRLIAELRPPPPRRRDGLAERGRARTRGEVRL